MRGTVELGPRPDGTRTIRPRNRALVLLLVSQLASAACVRQGAPATGLVTRLNVVPSSPVVDGEAIAEFMIFDSAGKKVPPASLRLEAHMTHPGMSPLVEQVSGDGQGGYKVRLRFTMAGAWVLYVKGTLADRRAIDQRLGEVTVRPAS